MPGGPAPPPGPTITQQRYWSAKDIANLARDAGFRDDAHPTTRASELAVAVAIALAESGGDSLAVNPDSGATGLWQIHPGGDQYLDAALNARTAWDKYVGAGHAFTPWTTYTGTPPAYLVKLPAAELAVRATHRDRPGWTGGGTGAVHDLIAFTGNIGHDLGNFFGWITSGETWIRLGETLAGAVLVLLALWMLFTHTETGKKVQGAAKTAATKGAM
jgi:hypothetical protein